MYLHLVHRCWQTGLQGSLCEERSGLSCAGREQFQPIPEGSTTQHNSSQDGGTSGECIREKRKTLCVAVVREAAPETLDQCRRRGRCCSKLRSRDGPAAPGEALVRQLCPWVQPVEDWWSRNPHCLRTPSLSKWMWARRELQLVESLAWSRVLAGPATPWKEDHAGAVCP